MTVLIIPVGILAFVGIVLIFRETMRNDRNGRYQAAWAKALSQLERFENQVRDEYDRNVLPSQSLIKLYFVTFESVGDALSVLYVGIPDNLRGDPKLRTLVNKNADPDLYLQESFQYLSLAREVLQDVSGKYGVKKPD